jgi:hypothetical protein
VSAAFQNTRQREKNSSETVMQRMELSLLAKLPSNQQKLITEGQPVILEIVVTETTSPSSATLWV